MVIQYSTNGTEYSDVGDIALVPEGTDEKEITKHFHSHSINLPPEVENVSSLYLKLTPYGGSNYLRFDNIVISKNNE